MHLTRDIYVGHNSGDLNDLGSKIWRSFSENRQISYPKSNHAIWDFFSYLLQNKQKNRICIL